MLAAGIEKHKALEARVDALEKDHARLRAHCEAAIGEPVPPAEKPVPAGPPPVPQWNAETGSWMLGAADPA